jgi:biopolymer transport protein ExbB/TolQ
LLARFAEALLSTALGLVVALPAALAYSLFRGVIRARMARATALTHEVLGFLKTASQAEAP